MAIPDVVATASRSMMEAAEERAREAVARGCDLAVSQPYWEQADTAGSGFVMTQDTILLPPGSPPPLGRQWTVYQTSKGKTDG